MLPVNTALKKCMARGVSIVHNSEYVAFCGYFFPHSHFRPPSLLPYSHLPPRASKEVNRKLSYHRHNTLSIIKHTNALFSTIYSILMPPPVKTRQQHNVLDLSVRRPLPKCECNFKRMHQFQ